MSGHTKEPWYVSSEIECQPGLPRRTRHRIYREVGAFGNPAACDRAEDAARIVACVNALEGVEDPSAALKDAREALRLALPYVQNCYECASVEIAIISALLKLGGAR